jgi:hypothetical protein
MQKNNQPLRICLFVPWLKSLGGAERVVLELLKNTTHHIDVYTWAYDRDRTFPEFKGYNIKVIAPRFLRRFSRLFLLRGLLLFFSKLPVERYDRLLISTSGIAELILLRQRNYKKGKTYAYCHTILRAANPEDVRWNLKNKYNERSMLMKWIYLLSVKIYNKLERKAWKRIDHVMFNSHLSMTRALDKGLLIHQSARVIYPPIQNG